MPTPYVIIGSGGHARVLLDTLRSLNLPVAACSDVNSERVGQMLEGIPVISEEALLLQFPADATRLVNGVGGVADMTPRSLVFQKFKALGYEFATLIHPTAFVAQNVQMGEGVQIMAGAIVITGSTLGENTLINTRASVDHECHIGAHCHLAPGTTLSGNVSVGDTTLIGTGASIIQGIHIGPNCTIGAGAVVLSSVPARTRAWGVPARTQ